MSAGPQPPIHPATAAAIGALSSGWLFRLVAIGAALWGASHFASVKATVQLPGKVATLSLVLPSPADAPTPPGPPAPPNPPSPGPAPAPHPDPQPNPNPPTPPGPAPSPQPAGLAADVASWVQLVSSPKRSAEAATLAGDCDALAAQIAAGTISGVLRIAPAIKKQIATSLGTSIVAWKPFGDQYAARLEKLYKSGALGTNQAWQVLLGETATGLRQAK